MSLPFRPMPSVLDGRARAEVRKTRQSKDQNQAPMTHLRRVEKSSKTTSAELVATTQTVHFLPNGGGKSEGRGARFALKPATYERVSPPGLPPRHQQQKQQRPRMAHLQTRINTATVPAKACRSPRRRRIKRRRYRHHHHRHRRRHVPEP